MRVASYRGARSVSQASFTVQSAKLTDHSDDYATSKDYVALLLTPAGVPASHGSAPRHWPTFMDALDAPPGAARYDSLEILGKLFTMVGVVGDLDHLT